MSRPPLPAILLAFVVFAAMAVVANAQSRSLSLDALRSGIEFAGPDVRAMQADDLANPAFLWVERGRDLWGRASGQNCGACHGEASTSMRGVATRYPAIDKASGRLFDLEARINDCRVRHQGLTPLTRESDDMLALTAFVAFQSRGMPINISVQGPAAPILERGQAFYAARHGQLNLSCAQCHEQHWGQRLFAETLSQGHGNDFPAYKLEWQTLGSLQRRIRACLFGVRAEMPPYGAAELTELELFLAWRAQGLAMEAPGVRR